MQSKNPGIATALGAAILFGASAPLAKLLLEDASPQLLAGLFYLGSGIGLGIVWLRRRQSSEVATERPLTRSDLPWLAGAIVFGGALAPLLLMTGLARTAASAASLLLNLEGVFTALLAWFVFTRTSTDVSRSGCWQSLRVVPHSRGTDAWRGAA